jgi:hypothetical protein
MINIGAINKWTWKIFYSLFRYNLRHADIRINAPEPLWKAALYAIKLPQARP